MSAKDKPTESEDPEDETGHEPNPRLQQFSVFISLVMQFLLPIIRSLIFFLLFISSNYWPIPFTYLLFNIIYDRDRSSTGGRRSSWLRGLSLWKHFRDYFPIKLVKTCELDACRNYVFGFHPHGIIVASGFVNFATEATGFSKMFPGITPHLLIMKCKFSIIIFTPF